MEGAVLFGLNPNKIIQRKARYTIGMDTNNIWNEEIHSKNGKKFYNEESKCWYFKDCFEKFITINESIKLGQEIIHKFILLGPRYTQIKFYKSLKSNPILVNEEGIETIGQLDFDAGKEYPPGERQFSVTMRIGGTFIDVKAKHTKSGNSIKTKLDFN